MTPILFLIFAAALVGCSLAVILQRNPVTSALFLVAAFCSLAGIYVLLHAEFVAMVQVIVYAGAIMVLFLFVIMYLNLKRDVEDGMPFVLRRAVGWLVGLALLGVSTVLVARQFAPGPVLGTDNSPAIGNTAAIGQTLYTRYLFPFEITSMVLLVAMVGAVVIARGARRWIAEQPRAASTPPTEPIDAPAPIPAEPAGGGAMREGR